MPAPISLALVLARMGQFNPPVRCGASEKGDNSAWVKLEIRGFPQQHGTDGYWN